MSPPSAVPNVEAKPARRLAVELERFVGLEEVIVRSDLNRTVTRVGHGQAGAPSSGVQ